MASDSSPTFFSNADRLWNLRKDFLKAVHLRVRSPIVVAICPWVVPDQDAAIVSHEEGTPTQLHLRDAEGVQPRQGKVGGLEISGIYGSSNLFWLNALSPAATQ